MYRFSKRSYERMAGIDRRLVAVLEEAIATSPIDFGIPPDGGVRTAERQAELFSAGASKADGVKIQSKHQTGKAVDFYAYLNGRESWDPVHLALVAGVILSVGAKRGLPLRWGGTFGSDSYHGWDMGHIEIDE